MRKNGFMVDASSLEYVKKVMEYFPELENLEIADLLIRL